MSRYVVLRCLVSPLDTLKNIYQGVFGMNISEINPGTLGNLSVYVAIALPLTLITGWIIIALQSFPHGTSFITRLCWPVKLLSNMMKKNKEEDLPFYLEKGSGL